MHGLALNRHASSLLAPSARFRLTGLALAACFLVGALSACSGESDETSPGTAADGAMPPSAQPELPSLEDLDPEVLELLMESQQIQQRLNDLTDQVLSEPGLADELEALQDRIDGVFRARNPELVETMDRFQGEYEEARSRNDQEAQQRIQFEVAEVREQLAEAQQAVLDDPEIARAIEVFEARQRARMVEVDPEAEALFARLEALEQELAAAFGMP
jgi:chaperonin cofactor prefoldin